MKLHQNEYESREDEILASGGVEDDDSTLREVISC
jgi:hypothetical protein